MDDAFPPGTRVRYKPSGDVGVVYVPSNWESLPPGRVRIKLDGEDFCPGSYTVAIPEEVEILPAEADQFPPGTRVRHRRTGDCGVVSPLPAPRDGVFVVYDDNPALDVFGLFTSLEALPPGSDRFPVGTRVRHRTNGGMGVAVAPRHDPFWVRVAWDVGGEPEHVFLDNLEALPAARLDPREPEPAAMVAPAAWEHGDDAVVVDGPFRGHAAKLYCVNKDGLWTSAVDGCMVNLHEKHLRRPGPIPPELPPWQPAIASGAALWQQADAMHREVMISGRGHVVQVTASRRPGEDAYSARFLGPFREEAVPALIDAALANGDHEPVRYGGSDPAVLPDAEVAR